MLKLVTRIDVLLRAFKMASIVGIILSFLKPRDVLSLATCCKKAPNPPLVTMDQSSGIVF